MDALRLLWRFSGFVRQGYPQNVPAVGHCALVALMPHTAAPDQHYDHRN
ncbi:hypothetical protein CCUG60885_03547 [Mycobacteroides salmoniphilum]|uniref:Uncharacterized protein n=1 Tax=Mycobacteroides salmoniphilum TaxID=404941 RepID=A0A4R8SCL7_9MYCO|nr:hypothetical protein CCUG60885_03547 [Mycobacteroides salmoniphilum]TEA07634.1 hypothetical protein CCUG60883_00697 [Mycobacteroides salmoniphilum]